ncbi:hypothetical protein [Nonomuraea sp. NPDC049784]|uniref:hypothetical protein n=1 Tax=Nonomuraea sp. NPDC049784 TaxID=3154361 RepID=UPI00340C5C69
MFMGRKQQETFPVAAKTLLSIRVLNQLGSYALAFLAVLTGLNSHPPRWRASGSPP